MVANNRTLIFFTDTFPFGTSETFIENEFPFLAETFDKIIIITNNLTDNNKRKIPDDVEVIRIPYKPLLSYKILALLNYFNPVLQNEINLIKSEFLLRANNEILSIMLASYAKAMEVCAMLERLVKEKNIDRSSLYLYSYWMNDITAGLALYRSKNPEVKAFCRVHRWDVYFETQTPPYLPLRNFMIKNLDKAYCISNDAISYLQKLTAGRYNQNLTISRLGTFNRDNIVAQYNENMLRLVSCSNIIPLKRMGLIIEALEQIKDIEIEWHHFGKGPLEAELKEQAAAKLGNKPNIKYNFAGQVSNAQLLDFYKNNKVDLFINVSETEGIPVSIIEAASFGIPAIGTLVGGVGEILENSVNGFTLQVSCSPQQISNTIIEFYKLGEAAKKKMRANAIAIWKQNYSAEKNYSAFLNSVTSLGSPR